MPPPPPDKHNNNHHKPGALLTASLQLVSLGSATAAPSLLLVTNHYLYLFNSPEGTQRLIDDHHITSLRHLSQLFMTRQDYSALGGLCGMTLTLLDAHQAERLTIRAPPPSDSVGRYFSTLEPFLQIPLDSISFPSHSHQDEFMSIETISLSQSSHYVGRLAKHIGHLNVERCRQLGVVAGSDLHRLKDGFDIVLPDSSTTIRSADVRQADSDGEVFAIVDLQCGSELSELEKRLPAKIDVIVHMTRREVAESAAYRQWVDAMRNTAKHWFVNGDDDDEPSSCHPYRMQSQLSLLDERLFPLLPLENGNASSATAARPMQSYQLRPHEGLDDSACFQISVNDYREEIRREIGGDFDAVLERCRANMALPSTNHESEAEYPRVVFLGTGSAVARRLRNTSAILLEIDEANAILLDCGEGTYGQLRRFFGRKLEMRRIKGVYVSHPHADHHLGLVDVLRHRAPSCDPLWIFAPQCIDEFLTRFEAQVERLAPFSFVSNETFLRGCGMEERGKEIARSLGVDSIVTCPVEHHVAPAYGLAIEAAAAANKNTKWKLVYSGDTRPCRALVDIGLPRCDLLIHEATMEDERAQEAKRMYHSTAKEALESARAMCARHTVLTHFSQRKKQLHTAEPKAAEPEAAWAFDFLCLRLLSDDCARASALRPVQHLMFP